MWFLLKTSFTATVYVMTPDCCACGTLVRHTLNKQAGTKMKGSFPVSAQGEHSGWCVCAVQTSVMARSLHLHMHHLACDGGL